MPSLLVVGAILVRVPARRLGVAPVVVLAAAAPAFLLFAGTTSLVSLEVLPGRYLHVASLLTLPLVAVVWTRLAADRTVLVVLGVAVVAVATVANGVALVAGLDDYRRITDQLQPEVLAMASIPDLERFAPDAHLSEPLLSGVTVDLVGAPPS